MRDGETRSHRVETQRSVQRDLKKCPLCEAINAVGNAECFVCSWHGEFVLDEQEISKGLDELMGRYPELLESACEDTSRRFSMRGLVSRIWQRVKADWRKTREGPQFDWS